MTNAQYKSRSWKRTKKAGGVIQYKRKKPDKSRCECGRLLSGVKKSGAKSEKKVNRKHGGKLCPRCLRKIITIRTTGAG